MTTPTVGRFLPGDVPASPAQHRARRQFLRETEAFVASVTSDCVWVDGVCQVRKALHRAALDITKIPAKTKAASDERTSLFEAANRALAEHHCGPVTEPGMGDPVRSGTHESVAGPTRMEIDRHVLELMGAAVVYGMRLERKAHPDAPLDTEDKIEEAERRMSEASAAYHRAMDRLTYTGATYEPL